MVNRKDLIKQDKKEKAYKKDKSVLPMEHETEQKIKAVDYYNNLSDAEKIEFQDQINKKKLRESYASYVQYVFGDNYVMTEFHKRLCGVCQWAINKAMKEDRQIRILLSTPPQVGKSWTLTETLPSWFVGNYPDMSVILTAYNADIAEKFGDRNRQKVKDFGKDIFGIQVSDSQDNKTLFQIKGHQGQIFSTGIFGALTSNPAALCIVDDPFKNGEEAGNQSIRDSVFGVYQDSIESRLRKKGCVLIIVHTRWHEDDLIGRLEKDEGYVCLNFPAVWEKGEDRLLHRKIGETLCPELGMTAEWAERQKRISGSRVWNALYQGKPFVENGTIINRNDIKFYNKQSIPSQFDEITLSCDLSFGGKKKENDPNCALVWGRVGGNHYLLDRFNKKCGFQETISLIKLLCAKYHDMRKKLIEAKANGNATIELLNQEVSGVCPFDPKGASKEARFKLVAPYFESGNVYVPDESVDPNIEEVIDEWLKFPNAKHDEYVDTTTQYLLDYSYKHESGRIMTDSYYEHISNSFRGIKI